MLQPKKTKFRKQQKGRLRGFATSGAKVSFGEFGLKATSRGRVTAVTRPRDVAFKPNSPKLTFAPDVAKPLSLPFCCFLNFVFFGCNIIYFLVVVFFVSSLISSSEYIQTLTPIIP